MLKLSEFEFHVPKTIDELLSMLATFGEESKVFAGGTDLFPSIKQRLFEPKHLISLGHIDTLKGIKETSNAVLIGATTTLLDIQKNNLILEKYPALAKSASLVASVIIQGMATIGGNILLDTRCYYYNQSHFWRNAIGYCMKKEGSFCQVAKSSPRCLAAFSSDTVPALILYGAIAVFLSKSENGYIEKEVPLSDLYKEDGMFWINKDPLDILIRIKIPYPDSKWDVRYSKLRIRKSIDYPYAGVAIGLNLTESLIINKISMILNAVASMPINLNEIKKFEGQHLDEKIIKEISEMAYLKVKPLTTHGVPPVYRKKMILVHVERLLASYLREMAV